MKAIPRSRASHIPPPASRRRFISAPGAEGRLSARKTESVGNRRNLSCGSCYLHARSMTNFAIDPPTGLGCLTTSRSPPSPFAGDAVAIAHHHPSGPPPAPTEQATAPRSVVPSHPRLHAATAPTCHHNSHGHPRGSTTPLTTYHWLCDCPPPKWGYACALGGKAHHHLMGMGMMPRHARGGSHQS